MCLSFVYFNKSKNFRVIYALYQFVFVRTIISKEQKYSQY